MSDLSLSPGSSAHDGVVDGLSALFLEARRTRVPIASVPAALVPGDAQAAYAVQDRVVAALTPSLGPVAGWKVGAPTPEAEPNCSPIHRATIFSSDSVLDPSLFFHVGVEAEIVYRFVRDLPPRAEFYTADEVFAAVGSAHPAIEIFDSRFAVPNSADPLVHLADQGNHGAMIVGPAFEDWGGFVSTDLEVSEIVNGDELFSRKGGNSAGDTRRLLVWLANHARARAHGIKAGDCVLSGSTTGTSFVEGAADILVSFSRLGEVRARVG